MKNNSFAIHLGDFSGPLSLLYELIKKSEMNIYDIPIVQITTQYLDYLQQLKKMDIDLAGKYFVLAADLMAIKSKMLLPEPVIDDDEDDNVDPRAELVKRLLIYQQYQNAADELSKRGQKRSKLHSREELIPNYKDDYDEVKVSVSLLKSAFQRVVSRYQSLEKPVINVQEWNYSIKSQRNLVLDNLKRYQCLNLVLFLEHHSQIEELVTTFLAILEMAKKGELLIVKDGNDVILKNIGDKN